MPIDSSIYSNLRGPNFMDAYGDGLKMRDMMDERKLKQKQLENDDAVKQARLRNLKTNPDGTTSLDQKTFMSDFYKLDPEKAQATERSDRQASWQEEAQRNALAGQILGGITDQNSWSTGVRQAQEMGLIKPGEVPDQYDPRLHRSLMMRAMSAERQFDQMNKEQELAMKAKTKGEVDPVTRELQLSRLDKMKSDQRQRELENQGGANLPLDKKKTVETLSTKNANKLAIKNQIDAVIGNWENLSEDQKIVQGRTLLKTLNSQEGADAIGSEEAKRLGGLLEFKKFNLTEPGSFFGRDLDGFAEQARTNSKAIETAVGSNQAEIDRAMGRATVSRSANVAAPSDDSAALRWAMQNPKDPRAAQILQVNGKSVGRK